jgi:hypothetical protein
MPELEVVAQHKESFYGDQNIYHACLDLLSLPSQVYGTGGQRGG